MHLSVGDAYRKAGTEDSYARLMLLGQTLQLKEEYIFFIYFEDVGKYNDFV